MTHPKHCIALAILLVLGFLDILNAQIASKVYHFDEKNNGETIKHELKIDGNYFIHSVYKEAPPTFIKTFGGFYTIENNHIKLVLEFNSDFATENSNTMNLPYKMDKETLILEGSSPMTFVPVPKYSQALDGKWLFSGRVTDQGEERVATSRPRKTMKFLLDGHFQWIAFNTETMEFFGTGGGNYQADNAKYTENISYFSRDNARVGASLSFDFELKGPDWHHSGKSSKGDPLHEIWIRRE
ncbi:hypothetical protein [Arenibacter sp. H213]|uniref:Membrane or secreted protein n=1 Tax=Arenibacter antarcticus TaxID=2040469 RepID=A0ABW5VE00_9FLAO|nr:hypothetical protein [Arenibacter sp. H213]